MILLSTRAGLVAALDLAVFLFDINACSSFSIDVGRSKALWNGLWRHYDPLRDSLLFWTAHHLLDSLLALSRSYRLYSVVAIWQVYWQVRPSFINRSVSQD